MGRAPPESGKGGERPLYLRYLEDLKALSSRRAASDHVADHPPGITDLVEGHLYYVFQVAWDYRSLGIPFEDLLSEGNLGLIEAAYRFDPDRGVKFITYATWWIRKRVLNLVARQMNLVRMPKYKLERLRKLRGSEKHLSATLRRPPTADEVSRDTGMSVGEVEELRVLGQRELSLEHVVNPDSGMTLEETVADRARPVPDEAFIRRDMDEHLLDLVDRLPESERLVITHRFGFGDRPSLTLADIGKRLGVSRERVRQIEKQALQRLRRLIRRPPQPPLETNP
jgi:RNA polymerase sigma factor (sigma-70 family)